MDVPASQADAARADAMPGGTMRPRPALHFAPARNWMNDPNGLIQWNGRVHLFYQHNPAGLTLEHMAWGHASSTDLWNWADHPLALEPGPDGPDRDGCWSGCAVVHDGTPRLLYTGLRGQATLPCLASADDQDLIGWSRSGQNPVIASWPPEPGVLAFRDHTAWRDGPAWYQVIGGGLADRGGALFLYRSEDLRNWRYLGVFAAAADHGLPGQIWECPDVFTLGHTTVVIVSVLSQGQVGAIWMTGEITGDRFTARASGRCDDGDRYYAPQSLPLADGRRIGFGWLRESLDELAGQDRTRVGVMSLPRELYLENMRLRHRPARELDSARGEKLASRLIEGAGTVNVKLSARERSAAEFQVIPVRGETGAVTLRLQGIDCDDVEIQVRPGHTTIRAGNRPLTSAIPATRTDARPALATGPVRMYYDAGILEVYSPSADPAAVICNRDAHYDGIAVEIPALPGAPPSAATITGWSSGGASRTRSAASLRPQSAYGHIE
jgi:beta-fructofuranosidase